MSELEGTLNYLYQSLYGVTERPDPYYLGQTLLTHPEITKAYFLEQLRNVFTPRSR